MQESEFTEIQLLLKLLTLSSWAQGFDLQIFHKLKVRLLAMFRQCWAMYWQCSAMFVIIQAERSDYENKRTLFRYPGRRHKV